MGLFSKLQSAKRWDDKRPGVPGEHWLTLGLGLLALSRGRRSRSMLGRMAAQAIGGALMARAASGRGGILGTLAKSRRR